MQFKGNTTQESITVRMRQLAHLTEPLLLQECNLDLVGIEKPREDLIIELTADESVSRSFNIEDILVLLKKHIKKISSDEFSKTAAEDTSESSRFVNCAS